ncbi:MAG: NADH:flavin oxidoreductase [Clostridiales bacterium]
MNVFEKGCLGNLEIKNRIIRSATYEGMCSEEGTLEKSYLDLYKDLSMNNIGAIITGFTAVSKEGRALQPRQAILDNKHKIEYYKEMIDCARKNNTKIFIQLVHTGRQTISSITENAVVGVSRKKSLYFCERPRPLFTKEIYMIIEDFVKSALYAKEAGFDGVQLHCAHGYLIHQFIIKSINDRIDEFGIDCKSGIGTRFLDLIIDYIRKECGRDFVILVKISGSDDYLNKFSREEFKNLIKFLDKKNIGGIEISYGTMDYPLNIFRGNINLKVILKYNYILKKRDIISSINSLYKDIPRYVLIYLKTKKFTMLYNIDFAKIAKSITDIPIISVGGFRRGEDILNAVENNWCDFVSLSRPLICESDFVNKLKENKKYKSKCINCNMCVYMCETNNKLRCYRKII